MGTVVVETQSTLRDIEQRLDRFFRNPAERGELEATAPMFDQVCGVLSVLGADEPVAALRSVQASVRQFADPKAPAQPEEFARIAGNLGAVGFFIESMGQDIDRPRGMFHFDPATGVFSADLTQQPAGLRLMPTTRSPRVFRSRVLSIRAGPRTSKLRRHSISSSRRRWPSDWCSTTATAPHSKA